MNKQFDDEVFESLLKAAIIQNSLNELDSYPPEKELEKIRISEACDRKMRRMLKKHWLKKRFTKGLKITQRIASFIGIVLGVTFMALLQFKEVRAACHNIFIQVTEKYILFDYKSSHEKKTIEVGYIPDGYREIERTETETDCVLIFQNKEDDRIFILYSIDSDTNVDNEHYVITDITVNNHDGKYFSSTDSRFTNMLVWYTKDGYFLIESSLGKSVLMEIANNIK